MSRVRSFCITHNNYPENWKELWGKLKVGYAVFGEEQGKEGTKHLQGYVYLKTLHSIKGLQKKLGKLGIKCTVLVAKGTAEQNRTYCTKDGEFEEWGNLPKQGKRSDIEKMLNDVKEGMGQQELAETHGGTWARYYKAAEVYRKAVSKKREREELEEEYKGAELKEWQTKALSKLEVQNDTQILWVVDEEGNRGEIF